MKMFLMKLLIVETIIAVVTTVIWLFMKDKSDNWSFGTILFWTGIATLGIGYLIFNGARGGNPSILPPNTEYYSSTESILLLFVAAGTAAIAISLLLPAGNM